MGTVSRSHRPTAVRHGRRGTFRRASIRSPTSASPDATHGVAVGQLTGEVYAAIVLTTTDGGFNWTTRYLPGPDTGDLLEGVSFANPQQGWAVGRSQGATTGVILSTSNGGVTWTPETVPPGISDLHDVKFVSATQGWAVGTTSTDGTATGAILMTVDGGTTWLPQTPPSGSTGLDGVDFVNATTGWVVGSSATGSAGVVFSTVTGGTLWTSQVTPGGAYVLADVSFADSMNGWAVGYRTGSQQPPFYMLLATTSGGTVWTEQSIPDNEVAALTGIFARSATSVCVSGQQLVMVNYGSNGVLLCSSDGGATWSEEIAGTAPPVEVPEAPAMLLLLGAGCCSLGLTLARRRWRSTVPTSGTWVPIRGI